MAKQTKLYKIVFFSLLRFATIHSYYNSLKANLAMTSTPRLLAYCGEARTLKALRGTSLFETKNGIHECI